MELISEIINNYNIPLLSAFLLGILTSISPCPLATNIAAIAYISKDIKNPRHTILSGLFYTLGRAISYTLLAVLIYYGVSAFHISSIFQGWGDKVLGPILIIIGLVMINVIKINIGKSNNNIEKIKHWLSTKGYLGSLLLGVLFALAFCPYSGIMFFAMLMPLILGTTGGLTFAPVFALGTGLPVIMFSFFIAYSMKVVGKAYNIIQKIEKVLRYIVAIIFICTGIYYSQILIQFLEERIFTGDQSTIKQQQDAILEPEQMPLLDNSVIKEDNEVKEEIKNNHQYTIGTCPTYERFAEKMKATGFKIIKNSSTAESIAMLRKGTVDYVLSGRVLKPQEGNWDSVKISNSGYSFISSKDSVVYTKDLSNKNIYTDLNPNELKMHFNLNKVEKVNNVYDYLEKGIVITSWENTDYSKANIVHVINEENGSRNIFSRSLFLYCKDKCNNNIINIIKEEV